MQAGGRFLFVAGRRAPLFAVGCAVNNAGSCQFKQVRQYCEPPKKVSIAPLIRQVREKTGAGMMECKKHLEQNDMDVEKTIASLLKIARASTGRNRQTACGWISISENGNSAALCELNSETDFVSGNEKFKTLSQQIATVGLEHSASSTGPLFTIDSEVLKSQKIADNTVSEKISELMYQTGESINLNRCEGLRVPDGIVSGYVHCGRIGVLVGLQGGLNVSAADAKNIAVHIAACNPAAIYPEEVTKDNEVPAGQILMNQQYIHNEEVTVEQFLDTIGKPKILVHIMRR